MLQKQMVHIFLYGSIKYGASCMRGCRKRILVHVTGCHELQKTEIDAINGAIVEQAKLYNVAAPYNRLIVDLIHAIEESYKYQK